jgi:hypothetical protein
MRYSDEDVLTAVAKVLKLAAIAVRARPPAGGGYAPLAFPAVNRFFMARLYGCTGRLTAQNGGFRPGQLAACVFMFTLQTFLDHAYGAGGRERDTETETQAEAETERERHREIERRTERQTRR